VVNVEHFQEIFERLILSIDLLSISRAESGPNENSCQSDRSLGPSSNETFGLLLSLNDKVFHKT
jgi:hypothetical protein